MKGAYTKSRGFEEWHPEVWAMLVEPKPNRLDVQIQTHPAAIEYCLRNGVVGLGWDIGEPGKNFETVDEYFDKVEKVHGPGGLQSPKTFEKVKPGDLVWFAAKTKKPLAHPAKVDGVFDKDHIYLALVVGPWEYRHTPLGWLVDVVTVAPALIKHVGTVVAIKESDDSLINVDQEIRKFIIDLWDRYLRKQRAVKPVKKLGDEFRAASKKLWAAMVRGSNPGFREIPTLPTYK